MIEKPKLSYLELMDSYTDLKILNGQLRAENKGYKALLETAEAMLKQLREERKEFVEILKYILDGYMGDEELKAEIKKWEGEQ